jgi:hypothetical protein
LTTTATTTSAVGTYPITAAIGTLSAANYTFTFQSGTLTVTTNSPGPFGLVNDVYVIGSGTVSVPAANGVLANDSGPGQLTVTTSTVSGANGGTFMFNADGSFTYTRPANFSGFDYVEYGAKDALGDQGTATVFVLSQSAADVWKLYEEVLDRGADATGLAYWLGQLPQGTGGYGQIAQYFFLSPELLTPVIDAFYETFLLRAADPAGEAYWMNVWQAAGGPETTEAGMIQSSEFFQSAANTYPQLSANAAFVTALYERLLGRAADSDGLDYWTGQLANGVSRYQVALSFVESDEAFTNDVNAWFEEYLQRAPTSAELSTYVAHLVNNETDAKVQTEIIDLPDFTLTPAAPPPGVAEPLGNFDYPAGYNLAHGGQQQATSQAALVAKDAVFARLGS